MIGKPPTDRAVGGALLFRLLLTLGIKGGVVGVEILGVQMILGDAEGITDFTVSNYMRFFIDGSMLLAHETKWRF